MFNFISNNMSCNIEEIDGMNDGQVGSPPSSGYPH